MSSSTTKNMKGTVRSARRDAERRANKAAKEARKAADEARRSAQELAERMRDSDALVKAEDLAAQAVERGGELAALAVEAGGELAAKARERIKESDLDERFAEISERVRESDAAQQAAKTARQVTDRSLAAVGSWLTRGSTAEKLGVEPAKRRIPWWLAGLVGLVAGYAIGVLTASRRGEDPWEDFGRGAERTAADFAAAAAEKPLALLVREQLEGDPRTHDLPDLDINVADGTVFVRGTVPGEFDESTVRTVIEAVPGVSDVDLQVTTSA